MNNLLLTKGFFPHKFFQPTVDYLVKTQLKSGCIPWFAGGKADPWDHIEAAMGLAIGGEHAAAQRAYQWLAEQQLADGSWWANYDVTDTTAIPQEKSHRETNFIAYIATGIWHYFLVTKDNNFLHQYFPVVKKSIDFVLNCQSHTGEIYWAVAEDGKAKKDALVTACSSVYKSVECAILMAEYLGQDAYQWRTARAHLGNALRHHPEYFDRTWVSKERFSMDWFYPILAGVVHGSAAQQRIDEKWKIFVEDHIGCLCVSDEPWVTVAESCELTLALLAAGKRAKAVNLFSWLFQFMADDGGYWTGFNFRDQVIWPKEKTTWTAGAILLAADALTEHTGAARLFLDTTLDNASAPTFSRSDY